MPSGRGIFRANLPIMRQMRQYQRVFEMSHFHNFLGIFILIKPKTK